MLTTKAAAGDFKGTAITSTCGDPASYPSSSGQIANRYGKDCDVTEFNQKNGDGGWSAPAYSNGGTVSQEISFSKEVTSSHGKGLFVNPNGSITETTATHEFDFGAIFNFDTMWTDAKTTITGSSVSGSVYNMVPDAEGYGYYYAWKLVTFNYKYKLRENQDDYECFPVVTFLTRDVTTPPELPKDFSRITPIPPIPKWR